MDKRWLINIANIGQCGLDEQDLTSTAGLDDARSLGYMMMELMEIKTSILQPRSITLQSPQLWEDNTGIKKFLGATQHESIAALSRVC